MKYFISWISRGGGNSYSLSLVNSREGQKKKTQLEVKLSMIVLLLLLLLLLLRSKEKGAAISTEIVEKFWVGYIGEDPERSVAGGNSKILSGRGNGNGTKGGGAGLVTGSCNERREEMGDLERRKR